jgi:hypothetical protein
MKKILFSFVCAVMAASGAFALPEFKLSAGAGGYFTSDFGGGAKASGGGGIYQKKPPMPAAAVLHFLTQLMRNCRWAFLAAAVQRK